MRFVVFFLVFTVPFSIHAEEPVTLVEKFSPEVPYRVAIQTKISGMYQPIGAKQPIRILGDSDVVYDERLLPEDEPNTAKAIRKYHKAAFARTVGAEEQKTTIRPDVTRLVVHRSEAGKKIPFSPDGPLGVEEIDIVRTGIFPLALVTGMLPAKPVKPGDSWSPSGHAVVELTDFGTIEECTLKVTLDAIVELEKKKYAKLLLAGEVRGTTERGPGRQKISATAYFDLASPRLTYLNVKGTHELLDDKGNSAGKIEGNFTMTRGTAERADDLSDKALKGIELKPNEENSLLLFDDPEFGIKFLYPRRWRVVAAQGKRLTLEESRGGGAGILMVREALRELPSVEKFQDECRKYLDSEKWKLSPAESPRRFQEDPSIERFSCDATLGREKLRMEYAVVRSSEGGATFAARIPAERNELLAKDLDRILRSVALLKRNEPTR